MITDLKKAKSKVYFLLENYPATRDSDKLLWLAYLSMFHNLKKELGPAAYQTLKSILMDKNTCTMESVRRVRQKYQEEGLFLGRKRKEKLEEAENVREYIKQS